MLFRFILDSWKMNKNVWKIILLDPVAPIGGGWGGRRPPKIPKNFFFYWFHRFNVQYMYKHVKLYYISVHELLSIGGADTELLARQRKKKILPRQKKFCPPKKFVNWRPWLDHAINAINVKVISKQRIKHILLQWIFKYTDLKHHRLIIIIYFIYKNYDWFKILIIWLPTLFPQELFQILVLVPCPQWDFLVVTRSAVRQLCRNQRSRHTIQFYHVRPAPVYWT